MQHNAMDIEGLGDKLVEQLVEAELVSGYAVFIDCRLTRSLN